MLIAEDNPLDIMLLQRAFLQAGITAPLNFVSDGQEVIDYLSGHSRFSDREAYPYPCVILLDLKMPRVNGFDVLQWLRATPGLKRIPVVIFSSSDLNRDINRAYDLGANSFLVKTSDTAALSRIVTELRSYWCQTNQPPPSIADN